MSHRAISLAFQTDKSAAQYVALAQLVDQFAFDCVTVYCDAPFHPGYAPLLLMAPHIKRARVGIAAGQSVELRGRQRGAIQLDGAAQEHLGGRDHIARGRPVVRAAGGVAYVLHRAGPPPIK